MSDLSISVKWNGVSALRERLALMREKIDKATADGVKKGVEIVQVAAQANTLSVFREWTGRLSDSIVTDGPTNIGAGAYQARAFPSGPEAPGTPYGRIQELGGTIFPHNPSGRLWWEGPDGRPRSATSVTLPPRPYLRPALETSVPAMRNAISDAWRQALEG